MSARPAPESVAVGSGGLVAAADEVCSVRQVASTLVAEFEVAFAEWIGTRFAVGVSSSMAAVEVSLVCHGIGPGQRVVTTGLVSRSTAASAIRRVGAVPQFVDIDPDTYCLKPVAVEHQLRKGANAVLAVHPFGQACDMEAISAIASRYGVPVIEEASQSMGTTVFGRRVGSFGTGCFCCAEMSPLCVGRGGVVATNDSGLAARARNARTRRALTTEDCRMPSLGAAIALCQLPHLDTYMSRTRERGLELAARLSAVPDLHWPRAYDGVTRAFKYVVFSVTAGSRHLAHSLASLVAGSGFLPEGHGYLCPYVERRFFDMECGPSTALSLSGRTVAVPMSPLWNREDVCELARVISEACLSCQDQP